MRISLATRLIHSILFLGLNFSSHAQAQSASRIDYRTPRTVAPELRLSVEADASYEVKDRRDLPATWYFAGRLGFDLSKRSSIKLIQSFTQYTEVGQGQASFFADDTVVRINHQLPSWGGLDWSLVPEATVPVSQDSNKQGVISRPSVSLSISKSTWADKLNLTYSPWYTHQFNRYQTRINGDPLPRQSLGHSFTAQVALSSWMSWSSSVQATYVWTEVSEEDLRFVSKPYDTYGFSSWIDLSLNSNWGLALGFQNSDYFLRDGAYRVSVYDHELVRYYMTLSASI